MKTHVPARVLAAVGMTMLITMSASPAGAQGGSKPTPADVRLVDFTVPVRLSKLDRRIHSGQVTCTVVDLKTGDNVLSQGGIGGPATGFFSINAADGSFNDNVKISMGSKSGVPVSQYDQELKYLCSLSLSPDALPGAMGSSNWGKPSLTAPDGDMFQVKAGSPLVATVAGKIPAPN